MDMAAGRLPFPNALFHTHADITNWPQLVINLKKIKNMKLRGR